MCHWILLVIFICKLHQERKERAEREEEGMQAEREQDVRYEKVRLRKT